MKEFKKDIVTCPLCGGQSYIIEGDYLIDGIISIKFVCKDCGHNGQKDNINSTKDT